MNKRFAYLLVGLLTIYFMSTVLSAQNETTYTVADSTGDWGYPTPYGMYPRGPGYVRMSLVFDTLIWKDRDRGLTPALATEWDYKDNTRTYVFFFAA